VINSVPAKGPSMTRRLILALTLVMSIFWLLAVGLGLVVMEEEFAEIFDGTLQDTAERLVPLVLDDLAHRDLPGTSPQQLQTGSSSGDPEYLIYQVRDRSGRVLIRSHDAPEKPFDAPLKGGFWKNDTYQFYTGDSDDGAIFVQVADAFENRREALREGAMALFLPLILLIPVSGAAIWLVVRRANRPVQRLRRDIETKDGGNTEPIEADMLPRELQPIAHSVNLLMMRLRTALEAEREFASNSAHELRTPIAGALAQTQLLMGDLEHDLDRHRALQIEASLVRLAHLSEKLLQLSRAEAGIGVAEQPTDLKRVIEMVVTDFQRSMARPQRLRLICEPGTQLTAQVSADAFAIVIRNLIENALNHGSDEEPIEIHLDEGNVVRVVNSAPLMTAEDLSSIRRRFSRGNTSVSGSGLGLSIVDRLLGQMNAVLVLLSPAAGRSDGFEARVELPQVVQIQPGHP
jgi:two-component system OmpR family sensor kinase